MRCNPDWRGADARPLSSLFSLPVPAPGGIIGCLTPDGLRSSFCLADERVELGCAGGEAPRLEV